MRDSRRVDHQALTQGAFSGAAAFAKAAPLVVLDTVILAALVDLARRLLLPTGATSPYLVGTLEAVLGVFVFAPMIIAAHRYSVAGMLTPRLTGSLAGPIFGRFVKTSLILSLITVAGYAVARFSPRRWTRRSAPPSSSWPSPQPSPCRCVWARCFPPSP